jgi:hypothetical protein
LSGGREGPVSKKSRRDISLHDISIIALHENWQLSNINRSPNGATPLRLDRRGCIVRHASHRNGQNNARRQAQLGTKVEAKMPTQTRRRQTFCMILSRKRFSEFCFHLQRAPSITALTDQHVSDLHT